MNIGDLNKRITIEKPGTLESDGGGGREINWVPEKTVWASVEPIDANEFVSASVSRMNTSHLVKIRYYPEFNKERRILYKGKILRVEKYINKDDSNRYLIINTVDEI